MSIRQQPPTLLAPVVLAGALLALPVHAYDDDVDYSAPYLTVENGELVTKDPSKEHEKAVASAQTQEAVDSPEMEPEAAADSAGSTVYMMAAGAGFLVLLGVLAFRRSRKPPGGDAAH